jgi:hypothetical protein
MTPARPASSQLDLRQHSTSVACRSTIAAATTLRFASRRPPRPREPMLPHLRPRLPRSYFTRLTGPRPRQKLFAITARLQEPPSLPQPISFFASDPVSTGA